MHFRADLRLETDGFYVRGVPEAALRTHSA